jgi:hypothetical protein
LRVSEPTCNCFTVSIERRPEAKAIVSEVADYRIDRRNSRAAVNGTFADKTARIDTQPQEHCRASRPLLEEP